LACAAWRSQDAVGQHRREGGGDVAVLAQQVPVGLAQHRQRRGRLLLPAAREEHHGLAHRQAVLGAAEAHRVHAGVHGQLPRRAAQRRDGVGEAGPVDVQAVAQRVRRLGERGHLGRRVDLAELGGVADADHARPDAVHAAVGQRRLALLEVLGRELAALPPISW
jgi:hypothetical protein